jgi:hypothetical protein
MGPIPRVRSSADPTTGCSRSLTLPSPTIQPTPQPPPNQPFQPPDPPEQVLQLLPVQATELPVPKACGGWTGRAGLS